MRALPLIAAIFALTLLLAGCGGDENTLESLAGTPASVSIVKDLEAMANACKAPGPKTRQKAVKSYTDLAKITSIHPNATFGPEDTEVTMSQLLRHTVEKTGPCIGITVDANGQYHAG